MAEMIFEANAESESLAIERATRDAERAYYARRRPKCYRCGKFVAAAAQDPWALMLGQTECQPCGERRGEESGLHLPPQDEGGDAL